MLLKNKHVVFAVTGGIAAFKAAAAVSLLRKQGAEVKCIMTQHATEFITPLTLRELSGNPVVVSLFGEIPEFQVEHISLARWADILVIAPATANVIGKIAAGIADDLVTTVVMAATSPILLVPAMNTNMYENPIVQGNIEKLKQLGYGCMEPDAGPLACGISGKGRMPEPQDIVQEIEFQVCRTTTLAHKRVLVTAGGTREPLDPVRFIGNHSSGRMGFAIAKAAAIAGAEVTLVSGINTLPTPRGVVRRIDVMTTGEMKAAVDSVYPQCDAVIKAAAVADYRAAHPASEKIKKDTAILHLELAKNPDILWELGQRKTHQLLVGFAAETTRVLEYGMAKLRKKNLDMLVANDVSAEGAGFQGDTNIATLLFADGTQEALEKMDKFALATIIVERVAALLAAHPERFEEDS